MSVVRVWVRRHEYRDSMVLMFISTQLGQIPGVERAMVVMGTEANKELLATVALVSPEYATAGPSDLIIALRAADAAAADRAAASVDTLLAQRLPSEGAGEVTYRSLEGAAKALPGANLALISVPGRYAAREARRALELGLNVFLFSDNVSLSDEVELKRLGGERGLLVMGPDCGTAIVSGAALGFANAVRRGPVGIVGASGTGIQEVCALLDRAGIGISHALGTGGRDLSEAVGARTTLQALAMLEEDPSTAVIVLISKIPAPEVAAQVLARARAARKPVVACLLGVAGQEDPAGATRLVGTLAEAAATAAALVGKASATFADLEPHLWARGLVARNRLTPDQRFVRGLFSGGSLCEEAMIVWRQTLGGVWSNTPLAPELRLPDPRRSLGHTAVDMGDDLFTLGRPHPMIDPSARCERLLAEALDPAVAVLVLDVVLGYGAHPDMAGALAASIIEARARAEAAGRELPVVAHVCGTEADPQGLATQVATLEAAGAFVAPSNVAAAKLAAVIAGAA